FPNSIARPGLHASLIQAYSTYGQNDAVIRAGREFLAAYPSAPQRDQVALLMADAFARTGDSKQEFAIYDSMLQELARKADGIPLGEHFQETPAPPQQDQASPDAANNEADGEEEGDEGAQPRRQT